MASIQEVAKGIYHFETDVPSINDIFSAYIIRNHVSALVEPGPGACIAGIIDALKQFEIKSLSYIIPTHIHLDHGGAAGKLAELFPEAQVIVHPHGAKHLIDPSRLISGTKEAFGPDFEEYYGAILPVPESQLKVPVDGETINIGNRELTVVYAPGHTPNHICIFDKKTSGLFCGEALGTPMPMAPHYPIPCAVPPSFDMEEYLNTMEKLLNMKPRLLFYSHDGIGKEPEELILQGIENTRAIGDAILKSMKEGKSTKQIIDRITEHISNQQGFRVELSELDMLVDGYAVYFSKKYNLNLPGS